MGPVSSIYATLDINYNFKYRKSNISVYTSGNCVEASSLCHDTAAECELVFC